jgi:UDP-glucose 4-epimerase
MILVTGGLGFIGSHTVQALLESGEECVVVQRSRAEAPAGRFGGPVAVERADVGDLGALLDIGKRHHITGIVHLSGSTPWPPSAEPPVEATRRALGGLLNIVQAAQDWGVRRVGVASTIGVYAGLASSGPLTEDLPLLMSAPHVIPTFKKIGELLNAHLADATGLEIVNYRIGGIWGPLSRPGPFAAAGHLVRAAVAGRTPDLSRLHGPAYAEDAIDLCYAKDAGRALALLQLADRLNHQTYNVASGQATSNAEVSAAIKKTIPYAQVDLPTGGTTPPVALDITRLRADTGFQPAYDTERATADYIAWLRAGNEN